MIAGTTDFCVYAQTAGSYYVITSTNCTSSAWYDYEEQVARAKIAHRRFLEFIHGFTPLWLRRERLTARSCWLRVVRHVLSIPGLPLARRRKQTVRRLTLKMLRRKGLI